MIRETERVLQSRSGTFGMEAVARQFATDEHVLVLRNGLFSYRWTEIFEMGSPLHGIPTSHTVLKAEHIIHLRNESSSSSSSSSSVLHQYAPHNIEEVVATIQREKPAAVFAPHVETSTGIILPDNYIRRLADAVHATDGILVLDCVASGTIWIDMKELGVDVVITAPQKVWTAPPCAALVQLSSKAIERMQQTQETSFSMSLKRWVAVMDAYENGGFAYHTTPPTDCLRDFQEVSVEMLQFGLPDLKQGQINLGTQARSLFQDKALISVAAPGFEAPGVLVYYSPHHVENDVMVRLFQEHGLQIAKGVSWHIDEPRDTRSFRIGLFGVDKLEHPQDTLDILDTALDRVLKEA